MSDCKENWFQPERTLNGLACMTKEPVTFDLHRECCRVQSALVQSGEELLKTLSLHAFDVETNFEAVSCNCSLGWSPN